MIRNIRRGKRQIGLTQRQVPADCGRICTRLVDAAIHWSPPQNGRLQFSVGQFHGALRLPAAQRRLDGSRTEFMTVLSCAFYTETPNRLKPRLPKSKHESGNFQQALTALTNKPFFYQRLTALSISPIMFSHVNRPATENKSPNEPRSPPRNGT
jgi:hypothetical protein